jgi:hypothetical protein
MREALFVFVFFTRRAGRDSARQVRRWHQDCAEGRGTESCWCGESRTRTNHFHTDHSTIVSEIEASRRLRALNDTVASLLSDLAAQRCRHIPLAILIRQQLDGGGVE